MLFTFPNSVWKRVGKQCFRSVGSQSELANDRRAYYFTLILSAVFFFTNLYDRDLWASHEARAAQNAQFILNTHSLGVSRLADGTPERQKPPLYYWLVAGVAWLRGGIVDPVAVRLPAAIAGWLTVFVVMSFLRQQGKCHAAWIEIGRAHV